jgi:hypothetical protein
MYIFPRFGTLYQEKSGNPELKPLFFCGQTHFTNFFLFLHAPIRAPNPENLETWSQAYDRELQRQRCKNLQLRK